MGKKTPVRMLTLLQGIVFIGCLGFVSTQSQEKEAIELEIIPPVSHNGVLQVPLGGTKVITCRANVPNMELVKDMKWYWSNGDEVQHIDGKIELIPDGPGVLSLYFGSVQETELGRFRCTAVYANSNPLEVSFQLGVFLPITFENYEKNQYANKNEMYKVKCRVKSDPTARVTWKKDHQTIVNDEHYLQDTDGLIITNVTEADEGVYDCRATVKELGEVKSVAITLQVQEKPVITHLVKDIEGVEGEPLHMKCTGTGKPIPEVEWIHNGLSLYGTERRVVDKYKGTLEITELRAEDRGTYNCRLKNVAGEVEASTELLIITKPVVEEFNNVTSQVDGSAVLVCRARGTPAPDVVFQKDSWREPFGASAQVKDTRIYQEQTRVGDDVTVATLTISDLLRTDDGLYNCIAYNRRARTEKMGHLTVEFAPTFVNTVMNEAWSWDGKATNLTCRAEAIPNATIAWFLEGGPGPSQEVNEGPNVKRYGFQSESTLEIRPIGLENFGYYTCVATNKISKAQHTIQFKEAHKPTGIRQVVIKSKTATTVSFEIAGPPDNGGLPVDSYVIQYKHERATWDDPVSKSWPVEESPITIEDLEPLRTYSFRFAARNLVGVGTFSQDMIVVMPKRAAPEPPPILTDISSGHAWTPYSDQIEIKWANPQDNGERVNQFKISYIPIRNGTNTWESYGSLKVEIVEAGTLSHTIRGLASNTFYEVEIRAQNVLGWGEASRLIIKTAPPSGNSEKYNSNIVRATGITLPLIIAIGVAALLITLLIVDFACCHINQRGLFYAASTKMCSKKKSPVGSELKGSTNGEKQPFHDDALEHGFMNPEDLQIPPTHHPLISDGSAKSNGNGHGSTNTMV